MQKLGLAPPEISTQVTQPEYVADYVYALTACWGVFANLADDFRHLQRSEIRELRDTKAADPNTQIVGSSTMPHKVNPKDFENVKSLWKAYMPRLTTVLMDQISEHQRDLTNSASMRFVTEFVAAFAYAIHRLQHDAGRRRAGRRADARGAGGGQGPDHRGAAVRAAGDARPSRRARESAQLARDARIQKRPLSQLLREDASIASYLAKMSPEQLGILDDPGKYLGAAEQRTNTLCDEWEVKVAAIRS